LPRWAHPARPSGGEEAKARTRAQSLEGKQKKPPDRSDGLFGV